MSMSFRRTSPRKAGLPHGRGHCAFTSFWHYTLTFYEIELGLRERRALGEDRLTLLKELRKVKRELGYDRHKWDRREIILDELLIGKGGRALVDRRYSSAVRAVVGGGFLRQPGQSEPPAAGRSLALAFLAAARATASACLAARCRTSADIR
jgi:hypothetical protein